MSVCVCKSCSALCVCVGARVSECGGWQWARCKSKRSPVKCLLKLDANCDGQRPGNGVSGKYAEGRSRERENPRLVQLRGDLLH